MENRQYNQLKIRDFTPLFKQGLKNIPGGLLAGFLPEETRVETMEAEGIVIQGAVLVDWLEMWVFERFPTSEAEITKTGRVEMLGHYIASSLDREELIYKNLTKIYTPEN